MVINMESVIYDYYGYNFTNNEEGIYKYKDYNFLFLAVSEEEKDIEQMQNIINKVSYVFNNDVVYIVKKGDFYYFR